MNEHKEPPAFKGGQGRSAEDVLRYGETAWWLGALVGRLVIAGAVLWLGWLAWRMA